MTEPSQIGCRTCQISASGDGVPGGVILDAGLWRLEHAVEPVPRVGWLVLKPLRHVEAFAELTEEEAAEVGPLVRRAAAALEEELQPAKVYVAAFGEAPGFAHLHFHIIPRLPDDPPELRGPGIFSLFGVAREREHDQSNSVSAPELASRLRDRLA